ncbi:glycosyltransferase family 4 protein [Paenibacillus sp. VCA1]|uniref:glycosyltransferase family 4 protein n=1 Tax=Paenibacillus sp. VCA1 TaxID=3039148 RepID=UPI0028712DAC|nr:glycosyltransferase family 4 protein [Paenibacillus sp. VCA1]MDR9856683.1 glycosyltransferase family 4 protein [Paenibacillus sp. VCA1]
MNTYKPKIMLFSHVCNTGSITGAEKLLLLFCLQITPYFECILVAPQEGKLTASARKQGMKVRIQSYPLLFGMYQPGEQLEQEAEALRHHADFGAVVRCIAETAPDIVLTNTIVNVMPAVAAKLLGIPVLWKITETMQTTAHTSAAIAVVEKYSDCLIAISEVSARVFRGAVSRPITLLPPSSDDALLQPSQKLIRNGYRKILRLKDSHVCIGYISSFIHPEKGLLEFIRMAAILAASFPNCRFVMIGKPSDQSYYDRCVDEVNASGHRNSFRFIPFVESVQSAYSAMDILVVPSMVQEGFGMTALEGMLCGKPVVAFDSGGLGELMNNTGNASFTVPTGDYAALAAKVSELLNHPELLQYTGSMNASAARNAYGLEAYRQRIHVFVQGLQHGCPDWMSGAISQRVAASGVPQIDPAIHPENSKPAGKKRPVRRRKLQRRRARRPGRPAATVRRRRLKRKAGAGKRSKRRSQSIKRK